jgi:1-acyl-sn-glycerol-3-phosphate acyltransferase
MPVSSHEAPPSAIQLALFAGSGAVRSGGATWHDVSVFYWLTKMTLGMTLKIVFRPRARGVKNVPRRGPVILASNHLSFSDHFFGPLPVPRKVIFLAKSEYFTGRGIKGLLSKAFFTGVGQIPVDRGGGVASEQAIKTGLRVLAEGHVLGIYPEGTRSPDGRLYRGKTGVARLAVESGAPVVPCAMINTFQFLPPGTLWPNARVRPGVRFGRPTARCCGPSPTRSCRRSPSFPGRTTSTSTPAAPRPSSPEAGRATIKALSIKALSITGVMNQFDGFTRTWRPQVSPARATVIRTRAHAH